MRASDAEVIGLVERQALFRLGLSFIDAHLLAATLLTPGAKLWTRDRRLADAAVAMGIAASHVLQLFGTVAGSDIVQAESDKQRGQSDSAGQKEGGPLAW